MKHTIIVTRFFTLEFFVLVIFWMVPEPRKPKEFHILIQRPEPVNILLPDCKVERSQVLLHSLRLHSFRQRRDAELQQKAEQDLCRRTPELSRDVLDYWVAKQVKIVLVRVSRRSFRSSQRGIRCHCDAALPTVRPQRRLLQVSVALQLQISRLYNSATPDTFDLPLGEVRQSNAADESVANKLL